MTGLFEGPHLLILVLVLVLLFGSAKLPRLAKSLGESARIFKKETQKLHEESGPQAAPPQQQAAPAMIQQAPAQQAQAQQAPETAEAPRTSQQG